MAIFGRMNQSGVHVPVHLDTPNLISALFHIINVTSVGATNYDDGSTIKNPGKCVQSVPFEHGQLQIGYFEEISHEVESWEGPRFIINLNFKLQFTSTLFRM